MKYSHQKSADSLKICASNVSARSRNDNPTYFTLYSQKSYCMMNGVKCTHSAALIMNEWLQNNYLFVVVGGVLISIGIWIGRVNSDRAAVVTFMKEIRDDIKKIFLRLPALAVSGNSPLHLTEFGKKIAESFRADYWAKELAPRLLSSVEGKEPFEIDDFCNSYVNDQLDRITRIEVKKCAYDFGVASDSICSVLKVVLRDELLRIVKS